MHRALAQKTLNVTPPAAIVDNAAFPTTAIDTNGYGFLTVEVAFGAMDIAIAAMKLQESDDSGMSGATDVPDSDYTGSFPGATADNTIYAWHVNLKGRKRYIDVVLTGGDGTAGTFADVKAHLSEPQILPSSATDRGYAAEKIC